MYRRNDMQTNAPMKHFIFAKLCFSVSPFHLARRRETGTMRKINMAHYHSIAFHTTQHICKSKGKIPISISTPTLFALTPSKMQIRRAARGLQSKLSGKGAIKLYRTVPSYRFFIRDIIKADVSIIETEVFCSVHIVIKVFDIPILSVFHCLHPVK